MLRDLAFLCVVLVALGVTARHKCEYGVIAWREQTGSFGSTWSRRGGGQRRGSEATARANGELILPYTSDGSSSICLSRHVLSVNLAHGLVLLSFSPTSCPELMF